MLYSRNLAQKETFHSEYLDEDIVDLLGGTFEIPESYACNVVPCDPGYEARMDLIADTIYGDDIYMDLLTKLNGPSNPFEVNDDIYLIFPGLGELDKFNRKPAEAWSEEKLSRVAARPKAKTKNEKRKPNEAVIGDKRFNIDPVSKIIVY